ncbi:hypothetical protein K9L97_01075 [Candidatus Woesearchaeota archaeon]|nr:hypothetical protein [Candidatus Woesearchaeota archaeon]
MDNKPIYIKIEEYEKVEIIVNEIKKLIFQAKEKIETLKQIRKEEEQSVTEWQDKIDMMEQQVSEMQKYLN